MNKELELESSSIVQQIEGIRPFPWEGRRPKVSNLWDVLSVKATDFMRASQSLHVVEAVILELLEKDHPIKFESEKMVGLMVSKVLDIVVIPSLQSMDVPTTLSMAQGVRSSAGMMDSDICRQKMQAVSDCLHHELLSRQFYFFEHGAAEYFETPPEIYFGNAAWDAFPTSRHDMAEALQCFAFERYTACVSHLSRLMEGALRRLAVKVRVNPKKGNESYKEWKSLAAEVKAKIRSRPRSKSAATRAKHTVQLEAIDRFDGVIEVRNRCQHPDEEYNREEARDMLTHIRLFVSQVAKAI